MARIDATRHLCEFLADFRWSDVPDAVIEKTKDLFVDWLGSALAGKDSRPGRALQAFARQAGPPSGPSEVPPDRRSSSAGCAALVNGAASHAVGQDDPHHGSGVHPRTAVLSAAPG